MFCELFDSVRAKFGCAERTKILTVSFIKYNNIDLHKTHKPKGLNRALLSKKFILKCDTVQFA